MLLRSIRFLPSVTLAACVVASAAPAVGQTVRGTVRDRASGDVVEEMVVTLFDLEGVARSRYLTDNLGGFMLRAPVPGRYYLQSQRVGYAVTSTDTVALAEAQELDVLLLVDTQPVELEGVSTTVNRKMVVDSWLVADFYRRVATGRGRYVTRPDIERRSPGSLTDLLSSVPGVWLRRTGVGYNDVTITVRRIRLPTDNIAMSMADTLGGGGLFDMDMTSTECAPMFYLDGVPQRSLDGMVNFIDPQQLEGVEVYRSRLETPPLYSDPAAHCGAVLLWTRRAR